KAKYLFVTGITPALSDSNHILTFEIVDRYRSAGTKIVFDPNMRFRLWDAEAARTVFLELAGRCDILVPSMIEAQILTGATEHNGMLDGLQKVTFWSPSSIPLCSVAPVSICASIMLGTRMSHLPASSRKTVRAASASQSLNRMFGSKTIFVPTLR